MDSSSDRASDRSNRGLPETIAGAPRGERRRSIRQKLHTPVYASFNGPQSGMVVDLSELLDLNEHGFAVQTSQRLEVDRAVTVCLDLPETKTFIHCGGQVVWSDDTGRGGVRFSALAERQRRMLKEWMFANLMIGCLNDSARRQQTEQSQPPAGHGIAKAAEAVPAPLQNVDVERGVAAALDAVRLRISEMGGDLDGILQLVTERALSFTGACGAALALLSDGEMTCRARAGEPAPPLGARLDVKQGLSGECIRLGQLVACEDTESDPRVDPEVCRALGIRALLAAPIVSGSRVIGLLEVFSPHPRSFTKSLGLVLERLIKLIPRGLAESRETKPGSAMETASIPAPREAFRDALPGREASGVAQGDAQKPSEPVVEAEVETPSATAPRLIYRALLGLVIVIVLVVVGYVAGPTIAPMIGQHWGMSSQAAQRLEAGAANPGTKPKFVDDLQTLAEQGDAEAQWQLGARYHNGEGLPQDDVRAMQWFERAAEQGHVTAQSTVGAYYWAGRGVTADLFKAYFWSALAVAQGDDISKARLEGLASQMTREQVAAASQQAEMWLRTHPSREARAN